MRKLLLRALIAAPLTGRLDADLGPVTVVGR